MIAIMSLDIHDHLQNLPCAEVAFGNGRFLFHQGDEVRKMYRILDGSVHLIRHQADGAAVILQRAGAGSILAEASLFSERYHCDGIAMAATRAAAIAKSTMRSRLTRDRSFAEAWAAHLAREVQAARLRAEILSLRTVAARLDAWTAWHDGRPPAKGEWKIVAGEIGTSPEALYREIAKRPRG